MDRKQQLMALVNSEYSATPLVPLCLLINSISNFNVSYCLFFQDFIDYKIQILIRISNIVKDVEDHELYLCTPLEVLVHFHNVSLIKPPQKSFLLPYTYKKFLYPVVWRSFWDILYFCLFKRSTLEILMDYSQVSKGSDPKVQILIQ